MENYSRIFVTSSRDVYEVIGVLNGHQEVLFSGVEEDYRNFLSSLKEQYGITPEVLSYPKINKRRSFKQVVEEFNESGEIKIRKDLLDKFMVAVNLAITAVVIYQYGPFVVISKK